MNRRCSRRHTHDGSRRRCIVAAAVGTKNDGVELMVLLVTVVVTAVT